MGTSIHLVISLLFQLFRLSNLELYLLPIWLFLGRFRMILRDIFVHLLMGNPHHHPFLLPYFKFCNFNLKNLYNIMSWFNLKRRIFHFCGVLGFWGFEGFGGVIKLQNPINRGPCTSFKGVRRRHIAPG